MICTKCGRDKPDDDFYRRANTIGLRQPCKRCFSMRESARYHRRRLNENSVSLGDVVRLKLPDETIDQAIYRLNRTVKRRAVVECEAEEVSES